MNGTVVPAVEKNIRIAECDPENVEEIIMAWNVTVDADKCVGCGECVDVCPVEVYEMVDGKSNPAHYEECLGCESCVEVCETNAITVEEN